MRLLVLIAMLALAGCAERVWAPEADVQRAMIAPVGPPSLTLYTVVSTRNGSGGHSALLVNGPTRALFDPAGTFKHPAVPERNDVLYGFTPAIEAVYVDYHARETYDVRTQTVAVTPEQAAIALRAIEAYGAAPKATCNRAVTAVLAQVPGFQDVPRGWYPTVTTAWFQSLPGVVDVTIDDATASTRHNAVFVKPETVEFQG